MVELCVSSITSIDHAVNGGVGRLELCRDLVVDGLTPDRSLFEYVKAKVTIPVHVLIRPRDGSFVYSADEVSSMFDDIDLVKAYDLHGVVIGLLDENGNLPLKELQALCRYAEPLDITFHRASDQLSKPKQSLQQLIDLGFNRILSSGGAGNAVTGLDTLTTWMELTGDGMIIMPGGGINDQNADLFYRRGFKEIHLSAKPYSVRATTSEGEPVADPNIIRNVVKVNHSFGFS
jgi:copper homeostasis protein